MEILRFATTKQQQVAQLSQRNRAARWVSYGQKWKTGTGHNILRILYVCQLCLQPLWRNWPAMQLNWVKKKQN